MKTHRLLLTAMLVWTIAACSDGVADNANVLRRLTPGSVQLEMEGEMPTLDGAITWLNSPPLSTADLRGKVVVVELLDVHLRQLATDTPLCARVGEQVPESGPGRHWRSHTRIRVRAGPDNVRRAAKEMDIDYPVAVDSRQRIWNAFGNEYWPALYFVDAQGRIRHHQFGEGNYDESEKVIQQLLAEAGRRGVTHELVQLIRAAWKSRQIGWIRGLRRPMSATGAARISLPPAARYGVFAVSMPRPPD
jgi:hypothetical protein